jgi:hypothetical protein
MAETGKCKMCAQDRRLVRAHIIPESFYKPALETTGYAVMMRSEGYDSRMSTGIYDPRLVCEPCERLFSPWDKYGKELLLDFDWDGLIWEDLTSNGVILPEYDYGCLKLFFLSLVWRMGSTDRAEFRHVSIPHCLDRLAHHLKHSTPGGPEEFGILVSRFRGPAHQHDALDPRKCFLDPQMTSFLGTACVKIYLAGWRIYVNVGSQPFTGVARHLQLSPGSPLAVALSDFGNSKELTLMWKMARRLP